MKDKLIEEFMASKSAFAGNCFGGSIGTGTLPNSLLPVSVADKFIDETVDESVLLSKVRVVRVNDCQGKIPKLNLSGPVTQVAAATSCPVSATPTETSLFYDLVKYRSFFEIESDFLMCNIERDGFVNTFMKMFKTAMSNDAESLAIMADSSITIGPTQSELNNMLGANDGWLKQICACLPECNVIDAAGAGPSKELYHEGLKRIPTRFRPRRNEFRWISSYAAMDAWTAFWSDRETVAGDSALQNGEARGPFGVPFLTVPRWPEDIAYGSAGTPVTHILLTPPSNLIYVTNRREMKMEKERVAVCDKDRYIMHWHADFLVEDATKAVLIKNVDPCGTPYVGCETNADCKYGTGTNPCPEVE